MRYSLVLTDDNGFREDVPCETLIDVANQIWADRVGNRFEVFDSVENRWLSEEAVFYVCVMSRRKKPPMEPVTAA